MPDPIHDLAGLAPEDFVGARDALAKQLKAAGKLSQSAEVRKLRKPTVQAWVASCVHREHDDVVDALRAATADVAAAQEATITSGDRDGLRDAMARRRNAARAVGYAVEQVLARNGRPAHHKDVVLAAIEAAITDEIASGTFGLRDDLEPPEREPARDLEAERRAAEAKALAETETEAAEANVRRAEEALAGAKAELAAVVERHRGVERDA